MIDQILPQSIEIEKTVLGSMLISTEACTEALELIDNLVQVFYKTSHQMIYSSIRMLYQTNVQVDILTVSEALKNAEIPGIEVELSEMVDSIATTEKIKSHIEILIKKYKMRNYIKIANDMHNMSFDDERTPDEIETHIEKSLLDMSSTDKKIQVYDMQDVLSEICDQAENAAQGKNAGITTGFKKLDSYTSGFFPSDFIILAARPGMGKTAMMINLGVNCWLYNGRKVLIFSLEMSHTAIVRRMVSSLSGITTIAMKRGILTTNERSKFIDAANRITQYGIKIIDNPNINVYRLRTIATRLHRKFNFGMIMIDYLQLIQDSGNYRHDKRLETEEKSQVLKNLAKELNLPIVCLSQLSRACDSRTDRRPRLSDLRETGAIEQDGDLIMFLYRPYMAGEKDCSSTEAELIIEKQRDGGIGTIKMSFDGSTTTFSDIEDFQGVKFE